MTTTDAGGQLTGSELTTAENRLVNAAATGWLVDLRAGGPEDDPANGASWDPERTIRAGLLAELLTGQRTPEGSRQQPVRLRGAKIAGALALEAADLGCPLLLADCYFDTPVNLRQASAPAIRMPGCRLPGLTADQLRTTSDLELNRGFTVDGEVSLAGATIGGILGLDKAKLVNPGGYALHAPGLIVAQDMSCENFTAEGEIRLQGARIGGVLSFLGAALINPGGFALRAAALIVDQTILFSDGFTAKGEIRILGARIGAVLSLSGATLACPGGRALHADGTTVGQSVYCQEDQGRALRATGEVSLAGTRIEGHLNLGTAHLSNPGGRALSASSLDVKQGMWCQDGFTADGEISLANAHIGGRMSFSGARLSNPGGCALQAEGLTVEEGMWCRDGFTADGSLVLRSARIGGTLDLDRARVSAPGAEALSAARLTVGHDTFCRDLYVQGEVRLPGARIGGTLVLARARLAHDGGRALHAERLTVADNMLCTDGFSVTGEVCLSGASIGGNLDLSGARLSNPGGTALLADSLTITQCMFCRDGFTADGQVRMLSAHVGEAFSLEGATLSQPAGDALNASRLTVEGDLYARKGFTARGGVQLSGARISGVIDMTDVVLSRPGGQALDLYASTAAQLHLLPRQPPEGTVNLTNAKVGAFEDDPATWPAAVLLRGFAYDSFHNDTAGVRSRLRWLARDPGGYTPETYDQLASAYRRAGREDAARDVGIAKQQRRRQVLNPAGKLLNWLLYLTVGYGYRTWRAAAWLIALTALSTWAFTRIHMVPVVVQPAAFNPLGYALDLLLPLVDLGQKNDWQPSGDYLYLAWLLQGAGWILTTAVVAAVTGVLKRD